jgi:hypothetical protein
VKKEWNELVETNQRTEEDSSNGTLLPGQEIKVSTKDTMMLMVCVAVGVFSRFQRMNVENGYAIPLRTTQENWFERLGPTIQTYSTPHPGRVYDITPLTLILMSNAGGEGRKNRNGLDWMEKNKTEMKELVFAAILATTTGRITALYHWTKFRRLVMDEKEKKKKEKNVFVFPETGEIELFLQYIALVRKDGKMTPFISAQFSSSLPRTFSSTEGYAGFLRTVSTRLDGFCDSVRKELKKKRTGKEKIVEMMQLLLHQSCTVGKGSNLPFLASQIVYNIDEMIDIVPDKDWKEVEMGYGSKQAL